MDKLNPGEKDQTQGDELEGKNIHDLDEDQLSGMSVDEDGTITKKDKEEEGDKSADDESITDEGAKDTDDSADDDQESITGDDAADSDKSITDEEDDEAQGKKDPLEATKKAFHREREKNVKLLRDLQQAQKKIASFSF